MWISDDEKMKSPKRNTIHDDYPQIYPQLLGNNFINLTMQFNTIHVYIESLQQLIKLIILGKRLSNLSISIG
jgi:hypothetical protein